MTIKRNFFSRLYLCNRLLIGPLDIIFTLLIFIMGKSLGAAPLYLTLTAYIKPITSLFSFYLSSIIYDRPNRIRPYLFFNTLIGCLPCLLFPVIDHPLFYIYSYAVFMITSKAAYPAWIEILRSNTSKPVLTKTISYGNSILYVMGIALPLVVSYFMDRDEELWRYLFVVFALLKMMSVLLLFAIQSEIKIQTPKPFVDPLKKGWGLLRQKPAFAHYLALFFIGGAGIIGSQSILPIYFNEELNLSYSQLALAFSFCKGISFVLTSPIWSKFISKISLYRMNSILNLFTILFFILLIAAKAEIGLVYLAYLSYGAMLAGCELSRDLSGPHFSGSEDSTIYSSMNLALVGIRGCICPLLGTLLFAYTGSETVFIAAAIICALGSIYGLWIDRKYSQEVTSESNLMGYA